MIEASNAIKQLDLPKSVLSSQDGTMSDQMQSEMDFVNKKIDKAKQSIS